MKMAVTAFTVYHLLVACIVACNKEAFHQLDHQEFHKLIAKNSG